MKLGGLSLLEASALGLLPSAFCLLPSSFCLLHSDSAVGGGASRWRRVRLGGERDDQVLAGVGIVRLESQGFLELLDRLTDTAPLVEGAAQVVVGLNVIRLQAEGFLQLADRLVGLTLLTEG